ncbi:MAG: hypothetical protein L6264_12955 [Weeksellaceae bacterium]|nr:ATP-binding protein [Bacteroidota bacterium]MCG2781847.1 hypothetical protein [Weeksellaceae bacterium]
MKFNLLILLILLLSCSENKTSPCPAKTNVYYEKAWVYLDHQNKDSAFVFLNKAKTEFAKAKDSLGIAKCLMNMATIQTDYGDYLGSQENTVQAVKIFEKIKDTTYLSSNYNLMGTNELNLKNFRESIFYLKQAVKSTNIKEDKEIFRNNLAMAYAKQKQYDSAISIFRDLLKRNSKNALLLDNKAFTQWKKNKDYNAEPEMLLALQIREKEGHLLGQNASHSHLSDYFSEKNPALALRHARQMYEVALKAKSPPDRLEALQKLINLEDGATSKQYFKVYHALNDSLETARNEAKNQFAVIRYDSEKNKADFLKAQVENSEQKYHILKQYVALAVLIGIIISAHFWYKRRKERMEQENLFKIKKTELKYSKKIHDVVANGVYQIMTEVENQPKLDKDTLLDKLENIYEKSRDISYDGARNDSEENDAQKTAALIESYSSDHTQIFIIGNEESFWENLNSKIKIEIHLILQELLVNMKKHSAAKNVSVRFEKTADCLNILYFDDGIGLPKNDFQYKNGLRNTENRIFSCNGIITFDRETQKGTKIKIEFPLEKNYKYV